MYINSNGTSRVQTHWLSNKLPRFRDKCQLHPVLEASFLKSAKEICCDPWQVIRHCDKFFTVIMLHSPRQCDWYYIIICLDPAEVTAPHGLSVGAIWPAGFD